MRYVVTRPVVGRLGHVGLAAVIALSALSVAHVTAERAQAVTCWGAFYTRQSPTVRTEYGTSLTMWVKYRIGYDCDTGSRTKVRAYSVRTRWTATLDVSHVWHWWGRLALLRQSGTAAWEWWAGGRYCIFPSCVPDRFKCQGACTIDTTKYPDLVMAYARDVSAVVAIFSPGPIISGGYAQYRFKFLRRYENMEAAETVGCECEP